MEQSKSTFEKTRDYVTNSITLRLLLIGILLLLMNIPLNQINSLIWERKDFLYNVEREIANSWGHSQTVIGPELTIPFEKKTYVTLTDGRVKTNINRYYAHFLPEDLNITADLRDDTVYRGIYDVLVYQSSMKLVGGFTKTHIKAWEDPDVDVKWDEAMLTMSISDQRNITDDVQLNWDGTNYSFKPGSENSGIFKHGLHVDLDSLSKDDSMAFSIDLSLKGSENLQFVPVGKTTQVQMSSTWPDPSFIGAFNPIKDSSKVIDENGFQANWKVLNLNRSIPQVYTEELKNIDSYAFGVNLFQPVDEYTKTERSVKYAMLFISFTFLTFFFIQLINKVKIHPFQFVVVGLALCIFYVLLISISEHLGFDKAYLLAAIGIVVEIGLYVKAIFKSWKLSGLMSLLLIVLYVFIYVIIQMETHSLLMGSIGLFVIMGILMYLSRNIDWSFASKKKQIDQE